MRKPTRTISGVAPLAVMIGPNKCPHGTCIYCPSLNAPQSYTPDSPAVLRAKKVNYNPFIQVKDRISILKSMGHPTEKIEMIIMGGTFLSLPIKLQYDFIKSCYDALNEEKSETLEQAKQLNENAKHRCVALCIETRPDVCGKNEIKRLLEFGCTRVELGVQAIDDKIYDIIKRGHKVKDVIKATANLKRAGFKVGYHLMPGLPASNPRKDIKMFKEIFKNPNYRPDQIKIYPCQIIKGSLLEEWYKKGLYKPYERETIKKIIMEMLKETPEYCRIMRIMREIPLNYLVCGTDKMDLRNEIEKEIIVKKIKLKEIRFREVGIALRREEKIDNKIEINIKDYEASGGKEFFIQALNKDNILFGLLRLRLEKDEKSPAMIRELHVYGSSLRIGERDKNKYQHRGIGKRLMEEAEKIARRNNRSTIKVISGVGVRKYYESLGYSLDKYGYMRKIIK